MKFFAVVVLVSASLSAVLAQYESPVPPRINVPGAIPLPAFRPPPQGPFRAERVIPGPNVVRVRRPLPQNRPLNAFPVPSTQRSLEEAKPVTEEPEDEQTFIPHIISSPSPQAQTQPQFFEPNSIGQDHDDTPILSRFQPLERPTPLPIQRELQSGVQRFNIQQEPRPQPNVQPKQIQQSRPRPIHRPQYEQEPEPVRPRVPEPRPITRQHATHQQDYSHDSNREKKPVAQILRKYREEHEDGTITWGFENDDGSFKEETIGIDCVTRGRYGYVDPDGVKREYNYETGILCDPNKRDADEDEDEKSAYIDYQENKAVLPNGVRIDLANMGKKSKRPQGGQPNYYRN